MKNLSANHNGNHRQSEEQPESSLAVREDEFEPLLDSEEAAALLKIHPKTLQKLARNGEVSAIHIGKLWRFRASALDEWVKKIAS
jgi:excisionase family DNA binding protein